MAGGMDLGTGGKGGKKPLDVAINLVPFIDLMAVTISFLIMTAVWTQLSRLQISQAAPSTTAEPTPDEPRISLRLSARGYLLQLGEQTVAELPGRGAFDVAGLGRALRE